MKYTISDIKKIVQGTAARHYHDTVIDHLLTDSRRVLFPGATLFFALAGPRHNGHVFLEHLYQQGVRNYVIMEEAAIAGLPDNKVNVIVVKDTLLALQSLAAYHRSLFEIPVIGITGSNGKTIVKEWLYHLLNEDYSIVRSPKSYNSQIGVPLSVWQLSPMHQLALFEAGISEKEEMNRLEAIIRPTIGILTNIGDAHSEGFDDASQKTVEKLGLFKHASALIYCRDIFNVEGSIAVSLTGIKGISFFTWSFTQAATLSITEISRNAGWTSISADYKSVRQVIKIPFTDNASIENAIHCWCVLLYLGLEEGIISTRMQGLHPVAMRLELKSAINNCSLVNDSYSADLNSLAIALDFLQQQKQHEKKTVILSDILQSGRQESVLYQEVAAALQEKNISRLIAIGDRITANRDLFTSIPETIFFHGAEDFKKQFNPSWFRNELILVKGARVFQFEDITRLLELQVHQTILEINLNALVYNLNQFRKKLTAGTRVMAMVKAFSYGGGSYEIANVLRFHKVDYLAVAYADEGVELRKGGIDLPIMVMNTDEEAFETIVQYNLEPELYGPGIMQAFVTFLVNNGIDQYPVHLEIETGMNRLGFTLEALQECLLQVKSSSLVIKSVFSHLVASEDEAFDLFTKEQALIFREVCGFLEKHLSYSFLRHLLNSAGVLRHPAYHLDMVRIGIGLYGTGVPGMMLQEVSVLRSTIAQVKKIKAGDSVSYGRSGVVNRDSLVATVRIGYADGYPRALGNGIGSMVVKGKAVPTIGHVCMDMTMIDITDLQNVSEGEEVIVFGKQLPVERVAAAAGTIPYEILTGISQRVQRVYFEE